MAMILGVIGIALVAAIVTYVVLRVVRPPKNTVEAPVTTVESTSTTSTTLPQGPAITAAELAQLTNDLVPFVEQTRQLEFKSHPTTLLDDDATFDAAQRAYLNRSGPLMDRLSTPFSLLGLNPNDADMATSLRAFTGDRTAVFYDTVHNIVHVRAVPATPYLSAVLVVGLTEQLDDQHFETDRIAAPTAYGDDAFGTMTLVGGDAWRVAAAWANTRSSQDQEQIRAELQARRGDDTDTAKVPAALASWLRYPADNGVSFTSNLVTARSSGPLDAVFRTPPDGSAQVLAPARLAAGIHQLPVATPEVDGTVESSGTFGRFYLEAVLAPLVTQDLLVLAMNGYRGDTLVAYENGESQSCVRIDVTTGDSSPANMQKAITTWASERDGSVSLVDDPARAGEQLVRLEVCGGGEGTPDTTTTTSGGAAGTNPSSTVPRGPRP
ncbi:MAG TPA: hypothetical protein VFN21_03175 [Acidimicrobiales bacterium]|nr:hypothetical protein [Acidimicrobiales bacterium]